MKVHELLSFNKELLEKLNQAGVNTSDYRNVDIYNEYTRLKKDGLKVAYIVAYIAEQFNVSERHVYNVMSRMERDIEC